MAILKYDQVSLPAWSPSAFITAGTNAINTGLTNIGNALKGFRDDQQNAARNEFMAGLANQADTDAAQQYIAANQSLLQRAGAQTAMDAMAKRSGLITDAGRLLENQKAQEAIDAQNELNAYGDLRAQYIDAYKRGDTAAASAIAQKINGMGLRTANVNKLLEGNVLDSQLKKAQMANLYMGTRKEQAQFGGGKLFDIYSRGLGTADTTEKRQALWNQVIASSNNADERNAFRMMAQKAGLPIMENEGVYTNEETPDLPAQPLIKFNGMDKDGTDPSLAGSMIAAKTATATAKDTQQYGFNPNQFIAERERYNALGSNAVAIYKQVADDLNIPQNERNLFYEKAAKYAEKYKMQPADVAATLRISPIDNSSWTSTLDNLNPFNDVTRLGPVAINSSLSRKIRDLVANKAPQLQQLSDHWTTVTKQRKLFEDSQKEYNNAYKSLIDARTAYLADKTRANKKKYLAAGTAVENAKVRLQTAFDKFSEEVDKK